MFCSNTTSREKARIAASAAKRAVKRSICCKSHYKFTCWSCGEMINRGDNITRCHGVDGMKLRLRGAGGAHGLTMQEYQTYQPKSGSKNWVHIGCIPSYWVQRERRLISLGTDWGCKLLIEAAEWCDRNGYLEQREEFLERRGYPQDKWMKDRIIHNVIRFQAIWRGYIYKFPSRAILQLALREKLFLRNNKVGDHYEGLFDRDEKHEAIYSGEVKKIQRLSGGSIWVWIRFHHDNEWLTYPEEKFTQLKKECKDHKKKLGIEAKITGRLPTYLLPPEDIHYIIKKLKSFNLRNNNTTHNTQ